MQLTEAEGKFEGAFRGKYLIQKSNIEFVIADRDLTDFIPGEGRIYLNEQPEVDCFKWDQLSENYRSSPKGDPKNLKL